MSKILITGGLGYVGGRLARKLSGQAQITVSSRRSVSDELLKLHGGVSQINHQDILALESFPAGIDTVIHLAALNEIECVRSPSEAIRVNIDESRIILENSIAHKVKNFIFFSTAHVYGSPLVGLISENTLPIPSHPYAITHKAAEDFIFSALKAKIINGAILRMSNSFGAPIQPNVNRWTLLANDLSRSAVETGKLTLTSNGCQYRDFITLTDVENTVSEMIERGPASLQHCVYNLGSSVALRVIDFAKQIADIYKRRVGHELVIETTQTDQPISQPYLQFSIDRLKAEDFKIQNNVGKELEDLLVFCDQNFNGR
jgi:UDP-glucose 4-epimerase